MYHKAHRNWLRSVTAYPVARFCIAIVCVLEMLGPILSAALYLAKDESQNRPDSAVITHAVLIVVGILAGLVTWEILHALFDIADACLNTSNRSSQQMDREKTSASR